MSEIQHECSCKCVHNGSRVLQTCLLHSTLVREERADLEAEVKSLRHQLAVAKGKPQELASVMEGMFHGMRLKRVSGDHLHPGQQSDPVFTFLFEGGFSITFFTTSVHIVNDPYTYSHPTKEPV